MYQVVRSCTDEDIERYKENDKRNRQEHAEHSLSMNNGCYRKREKEHNDGSSAEGLAHK